MAVLSTGSLAYALDWSATASSAFSATSTDSTIQRSIDQQYTLFAQATLVPTIRYLVTTRFRRLQTGLGDTTGAWLNEFQPSLTTIWTLPIARLQSDLGYRDNRDKFGVTNLIGRSAGVSAQTNLQKLPQLSGSYQWHQNMQDVDFLGSDTRQQLWTASSLYTRYNTTLRYDFGGMETRNRVTGLHQTSLRHTGQISNSLILLRRRITLNSSYQVDAKLEQERRPGSNEILLPITPLYGLYAVDPTPEFGALEIRTALVDGVVDTAGSLDWNLVNGEVHNFGLDLGSLTQVDRLFLYTDTLAISGIRWAVYTSTDNLVWTLARDFMEDPYDIIAGRFEVSFPRLTSQYIKLVQEPLLQERPIRATEIRAILVRDEITDAGWLADHTASVNANFRPTKWLSFSAIGHLSRIGAGPTTLGREQDGIRLASHLAFSRLLEVTTQYHANRTRYLNATDPQSASESGMVSLRSNWARTLRTEVTASRQYDNTGSQRLRRGDNAGFRVNATILPNLNSTTDIGQSVDYRYTTRSELISRHIGETVAAQPFEPLQLAADYRRYYIKALGRSIPASREQVDVRAIYRITATITAQGEGSRALEGSRENTSWNTSLSWAPVPNLTLSASADQTLPEGSSRATLWSLQAFYRPGPRMDMSAGFSRYESNLNAAQNNTALNIALNLRI